MDLSVSGLRLAYRQPDGSVQSVLHVPVFAVPGGTHVGITGPSGSGKSSLLALLGGIEAPTSGQIIWAGEDIAAMGEARRDAWRRRHIGMVFQDFHLIGGLSALENVLMPVRFEGWRLAPDLTQRALQLLKDMEVPDPHRTITLMSRGEQQRVAIARAALRSPPILLADEPTASLDTASAQRVVALLLHAAKHCGSTLIVVSHDPVVLKRLGDVRAMRCGRVVAEPVS